MDFITISRKILAGADYSKSSGLFMVDTKKIKFFLGGDQLQNVQVKLDFVLAPLHALTYLFTCTFH